jgi:hypothetical protein
VRPSTTHTLELPSVTEPVMIEVAIEASGRRFTATVTPTSELASRFASWQEYVGIAHTAFQSFTGLQAEEEAIRESLAIPYPTVNIDPVAVAGRLEALRRRLTLLDAALPPSRRNYEETQRVADQWRSSVISGIRALARARAERAALAENIRVQVRAEREHRVRWAHDVEVAARCDGPVMVEIEQLSGIAELRSPIWDLADQLGQLPVGA